MHESFETMLESWRMHMLIVGFTPEAAEKIIDEIRQEHAEKSAETVCAQT